jgi:hypothetical protein
MPQTFHRSTNTLSRVSIFGAVAFVGLALWGLLTVNRSTYVTGQRVAVEQPVQFSHKHHTGELGIDCRYCHTAVEVSRRAGIPPVSTCMNCHRQIWTNAAILEPIRASFRTNQPIRWVKVNDLPDFVYFNHSVHVHGGIGCTTCHGPIGEMNQVWQATSLQMEWCLDCHRHPERQVRPRDHVFDPEWEVPANQEELGRKLVKAYHLTPRVDCTTCHR